MITAHIEDVTITQRWGDKREFERRVRDYAIKEGLSVGVVIQLQRVREILSVR